MKQYWDVTHPFGKMNAIPGTQEEIKSMWIPSAQEKMIISPSVDESFIRNLFKNYTIIDIDIEEGAVTHVKVTVENARNKYNRDIYIVTYDKMFGGRNEIKSILKVGNPSKRFTYQINGQPGTNTQYAELR
jgi:hypothetical protein